LRPEDVDYKTHKPTEVLNIFENRAVDAENNLAKELKIKYFHEKTQNRFRVSCPWD
jgi:hypothetical protein